MSAITHDSHGHHDAHHDHHEESFISKYIFSQDHKMIGKQFLITAVFMSHTQILQSIRTGEQSKQKSNQLDIPKPEHFIHKCFIQCSAVGAKVNMYIFTNTVRY